MNKTNNVFSPYIDISTSSIYKNSVMPRSYFQGSPSSFYYGLNLTDDPGNANFLSPIRMHYIRMMKYYYV